MKAWFDIEGHEVCIPVPVLLPPPFPQGTATQPVTFLPWKPHPAPWILGTRLDASLVSDRSLLDTISIPSRHAEPKNALRHEQQRNDAQADQHRGRRLGNRQESDLVDIDVTKDLNHVNEIIRILTSIVKTIGKDV